MDLNGNCAHMLIWTPRIVQIVSPRLTLWRARAPDVVAAHWLSRIAAVATRAKFLLTTRLMVSDLEDTSGKPLAGVVKKELKDLGAADAVAFLMAQGISKGTKAE